MDERRAIERLEGGDPGGLESLVRAQQGRAVRAAYLICRDRPLAEDVVQGAFVKAYEKIETFDGRRPFGPWFSRMVVNDAIKAASRRERTTRHEGGSPEALLEDLGMGPHELLEEAEERRRVWAALAKLPPAQRAAVVQRYYLGMSEAEMAGGDGSPPGTIKWRLHAAKRKLSGLLRPQFCEAPALSKDATEGGGDRG